MRTFTRTGVFLLGFCFLASPGLAFQVTLDSGAGSLTIVDNDGNDLSGALGEIAFNQTIGGVFAAEGRATQIFGPINREVAIGTRTPGGDAVFGNLDTVAHTFTVTVDSDTFSAPGAPLGWAVFAAGLADDTTTPTQGSVELLVDDVALSVDSGSTLLGTLSMPITPPVLAGNQPVSFDEVLRGVNGNDATQMRVTWTLRPGARDEIRLPDPSGTGDAPLSASVFNAEDKCAFRMNKRASRLAKLAGKDDAKCVKDVASNGGDATACVDDQATPKTTSGEERLLDDYGTFCTSPPPFATNAGTCCEGGPSDGDPCTGPVDCPSGACTVAACISGAAEDAATAVVHDLFGPTVSVGSAATGTCQLRALQAAVSVHEMRWRSLARCKQQNIATLTTEADFVSTCLGPPQPAFVNIAAKEAVLATKLQRLCIDEGVGALGTVFPGACAGESDPAFAACVSRRIACRFCLGAVVADDIATPLDCDVLDDGTANGSCP
jgi:hypothetical protein